MKTRGVNEFIEKAKQVHGDIYDYSKVDYKGCKVKVCIICPIHGEFWQTPDNHLQKRGCPKCCKNQKLNIYSFINKAKEIHGDRYDYSKVEYINNATKVCIICKEHGEFWQKPNNHLNGNGCPKCQGKNKTTENFIQEAKKIHGERYDYSITEYLDCKTKTCIICKEHGKFWITPDNHLQGQGCPYCQESHLEKNMTVLLTSNNIIFERQKKFDWLGKQSLDFYLPDYNIAIECQGIQHFKPVKYFGGKNGYIDRIKRDKTKRELCKANNIKLLYYSNLKLDFPYMVYNKDSDFLEKLKKSCEKK